MYPYRLNALRMGLSRKLVVNKLIFYRSVKISHLAALKDRENLHSPNAAR
jgi:hypothetical protein